MIAQSSDELRFDQLQASFYLRLVIQSDDNQLSVTMRDKQQIIRISYV
jgi:hypothetical protein